MSNIAEGFNEAPRELHQFLSIAKASCAEIRSQLYVALDETSLTEETFNTLMALAKETGKIIGELRVSVERRRDAT